MTEPMTIEAQYTSRGRAWPNELKRSGNGSVAPLIECLNEMTHEAQIDFAVRCIGLRDELEIARGKKGGFGPVTVAELMFKLVAGGHV